MVELLFNVSDIAKRTMAKRKMTTAEREAFEAEYARVMENAMRTRRLAEKAQAELDAEAREREQAAQKPER